MIYLVTVRRKISQTVVVSVEAETDLDAGDAAIKRADRPGFEWDNDTDVGEIEVIDCSSASVP